MPGKPDAARGKTTRKAELRKMFEKLKKQGKGKKTLGMSPGAMGGRTKTIGDKPQAPLQRLTPEERRKRLRGMIPGTGSLKKLFTAQQKAAKGTLKGAGGAGSALAAQAMKLAKQIKKTGRLSVADLQRAKQMMMEKKGK